MNALSISQRRLSNPKAIAKCLQVKPTQQSKCGANIIYVCMCVGDCLAQSILRSPSKVFQLQESGLVHQKHLEL